MIYYDSVDVNEYFLNKGFKFQPYVCYRCHDLLMMSIIIDHIAILNICCVDCRCNIYGISNSDAVIYCKTLI